MARIDNVRELIDSADAQSEASQTQPSQATIGDALSLGSTQASHSQPTSVVAATAQVATVGQAAAAAKLQAVTADPGVSVVDGVGSQPTMIDMFRVGKENVADLATDRDAYGAATRERSRPEVRGLSHVAQPRNMPNC